jgi:hypothetical protein
MRHMFRFCAAVAAALAVVTFVGASTASAAPGPWWADYFANPNLEGAPVHSGHDSVISFDWGTGKPHRDLPEDRFSVRWTRDEWFAGGTYRFSARSDDGIRIWVGDELIVDEWRVQPATWFFVDRYIPEGVYTVVVEYFEDVGSAKVQVDWNRVVGGATWRAEYFDNQDLEGRAALNRNDEAIDFDWEDGSPDPAVPADHFSVRWTRTLGFTAGTYRFLASCDDGVRIYVDGVEVVDHWEKQRLPNTRTGEIVLGEGQHTVVVEYFEEGGGAAAHVWWERRDAVAGWRGLYFDNTDFVGGPALTRDDAEINFDWGVGPPVDWMPDDNFAVRWTRTVTFEPGYYIFWVESDDGMRFWLDGGLLMDKWRPMDGERHYLDGTYLEGPHELKVEYYEQTGNARIHFWWGHSTAWGVMPQAESPRADPWQLELYANPDLEGAPALTRVDTALDYNWGLESPAAGLPADDFSARWTQPLYFTSGNYLFTTVTDDGVRLWIDGRLLIDAWRPMRGARSAAVSLEQGTHEVRMEYFERGGAATARLTWQRIGQSASTYAISESVRETTLRLTPSRGQPRRR